MKTVMVKCLINILRVGVKKREISVKRITIFVCMYYASKLIIAALVNGFNGKFNFLPEFSRYYLLCQDDIRQLSELFV